MQYDMLFDWEFSRSFKCLFSNDFREFTISSIKYSRTKLWLLQLQGKLKGMEMVLLECLVGSLWLLLLGDYHFRSWPFCLKCDIEPCLYVFDWYSYFCFLIMQILECFVHKPNMGSSDPYAGALFEHFSYFLNIFYW